MASGIFPGFSELKYEALKPVYAHGKRFMDICRSLPIDFEGGFFGDNPRHPQYEAFKDRIIHRKYGLDCCMETMALSAYAFNTPAVHGCQG